MLIKSPVLIACLASLNVCIAVWQATQVEMRFLVGMLLLFQGVISLSIVAAALRSSGDGQPTRLGLTLLLTLPFALLLATLGWRIAGR